MISESQVKKYCCEDLSTIENWDKAVADLTQTWDIHHRLEIMPWGKYSKKDLKDHGLYYGQPAASLVFLTHKDHMALHFKGRALSEEQRRKLSDAKKGHKVSEETKLKISNAMAGKKRAPRSEETKRKISEAQLGQKSHWFGKHQTEETKNKISGTLKGRFAGDRHPMFGKRHSEETKKKMSESHKEHYRKLKENES